MNQENYSQIFYKTFDVKWKSIKYDNSGKSNRKQIIIGMLIPITGFKIK